MFGLGKIVDGVFGKFFDSIGLGWMTQALSLTANIMSGNWVGAAQDVFNLVAEFTDSSWMDRVASLQPLGAFDGGGCFGDILSENTFGQWLDLAGVDDRRGSGSFLGAVNIMRDTLHNNAVATANHRHAAMSCPV
ncbi:MAG TPA: hypothetical protein VF611_15830 [Pyrinomonadaceae bacterium]|jgi:hypothetical protein